MDYKSGSVHCTRYALFLFHTLFLIVGLFFLLLSIWVIVVPGTKHAIFIALDVATMQHIDYMSYLAVGVGGFICIIAILGWTGTMNNNKHILQLVGIIMIIFLLGELVVLAFSFVFQSQIDDQILNNMSDSFLNYSGDNQTDDVSVAWRETQQAFSCCGVNTTMGFENHTNIVGTPINGIELMGSEWYRTFGSVEGLSWPGSCCPQSNNGLINTTVCYEEDGHFKEGCMDEMYDFLSRHLYLFVFMAALLVITQVGAMVLSFRMYKIVSQSECNGFDDDSLENY